MIIPLPGYVLVEPIEDEVKTSGGLYVPESDKDKPSRGKVVAIGGAFRTYIHPEGCATEYREYKPKIKVGQVVVYKKYTNQEIQHEGKKYLLVNFNELLAIIE